MAKTNHWGTLAVAAGTLVAVALLVLMLVVVNPQTAGAALPGKNGNIAYSSTRTGVYEIYTIDPTLGGCCGKQLTHNTQPGNTFAHGHPCYSPDGNTIGYSRQYAASDDNDIYTIPATGGTPTQITFNSAEEYGCSFTGPRGSHIVYAGEDPAPGQDDWEIFTIPADGDGTPTRVTDNNTDDRDPSFSPRSTTIGPRIAYAGEDPAPGQGDLEIFTIPATGGTPTQITRNDRDDFRPDFRPDGRRIVYMAPVCCGPPPGFYEDYEIFKIPATGGTPTQITFNEWDDQSPVYSPDGNQIAYSSSGGVFGETRDPEIFTIPATGGTRTQITFNDWEDTEPSWQPRGTALQRLPINVPELPWPGRSPSK